MKLLTRPLRSSPKKDGPPSVVLVERDPYLAFLIRLHVPEAQVIEADAETTVESVMAMQPDLVIAGVSGGSITVNDLLKHEAVRPLVLAVAEGGNTALTDGYRDVEGVIARPFAPTEVSHAVRTALRLGPREEDERHGGPVLVRARSWIPPVRTAALALVAVLEISGGNVSDARAYILGSAFIYSSLRWMWRRPSIVADGADVAVALTLLAATGGVESNYALYAAAVAAGTGLSRGPRWGLMGGLAMVAGSIPLLFTDVESTVISPREAAAWAALFPLVGLTGGYAERVWRQPSAEGLNVLVEANRVLSSLYRIARTLPGGLEIGSVADATMHEIRDALGASAGAMLLADSGTFTVVGSFGLASPTAVEVRDPSTGLGAAIYGDRVVLRAEDLHPATREALGDHDCWLAAPMRRGGIAHGLLLAACPGESKQQSNILLLRRLAEESTVAVENARLFSQVREISIDEERRRLARELHDGIAQSLTHLRFELDFMARHGEAPEPIRRDVSRLSRVVERTSNEVRSMIVGLRAAVAAEGLIDSLRSFLGDLQRLGGPRIIFDARGEVRLPHDVEGEIFRVAQESVSNAMRHAQASTIRVRLESGAHQVRLIVEDDGVGMKPKRPRRGGGVGLDAMRERAELIGADLSIEPREPHGTRVVLDYSLGRAK